MAKRNKENPTPIKEAAEEAPLSEPEVTETKPSVGVWEGPGNLIIEGRIVHPGEQLP